MKRAVQAAAQAFGTIAANAVTQSMHQSMKLNPSAAPVLPAPVSDSYLPPVIMKP